MAIQDYDISIEHCSGKNNLVADTLSRLPEQENAAKMSHKDGKIILYAFYMHHYILYLYFIYHQTYVIGYKILPKSKN